MMPGGARAATGDAATATLERTRQAGPPPSRAAAVTAAPRATTAGERAWLALVAVFLGVGLGAALLLRLREIRDPLWLDESWSVWFARLPLDVLWTEVPTYEAHPSFYYTFLKLVLLVGSSELVLRLPSVLFSLLVLPVAWRILDELPDRAAAGRGGTGPGLGRAGLLAALFCGLSAVQISCAQEARPYAALTLSVAVMILFALRWIRDLESPRDAFGPPAAGSTVFGVRWSNFAGLVLSGGLTCWLHNVGGLYVAAVLIPLGLISLAPPAGRGWRDLGRARRRALAALIVAAAAIIAIILPNLPFLAQRSGDWSHGTWMAPLTLFRTRMVLQELINPVTPPTDGYGAFLPTLALLLLAGLGLWVVLRRSGPRQALLLGCCAGLPLAGAIGASLLTAPIFATRTMLAATVPLYLLVALGCVHGPLGRGGRGVATALVVLGFALGASAGYPGRPHEPWDRLAQRLIAGAAPGEPVLVVRNDAALGVGHYLDRAGQRRDLRPLPAPYPAMGLPNNYPYGSPALPEISEADVRRALTETAAAPVVWLLERVEGAPPTLRDALEAVRPTEADDRFGTALRLTKFGPPLPRPMPGQARAP